MSSCRGTDVRSREGRDEESEARTAELKYMSAASTIEKMLTKAASACNLGTNTVELPTDGLESPQTPGPSSLPKPRCATLGTFVSDASRDHPIYQRCPVPGDTASEGQRHPANASVSFR